MTIRVLHVLNDLRGGATMSARTLMREGLRRGSDVEHFAVYPGRMGDRNAGLEGVAADWSGVPIRTWQKQSWQSVTSFLRWFKSQLVSGLGVRGRSGLRKLIRQWDIDLVHTNTAIVADGALVARELGIPHVWHIREKIGTGGFMEFPMADHELSRFIADSSARVPVISSFVQDFFTRHGQEAATQLVHDGIDILSLQGTEVAARGRALREQWGVPENAILIGMVGGLKTRVKRHDLFLEMAHQVGRHNGDARFVVAGGMPSPRELGPNTWVGSILAQVDELGLRDKLIFSGFLEDMPAVWSAMDIYLHLCPIEGFSRAILEAMASATPVVAVDAGGNPEAVIDQETGLLVPEADASPFVEAVKTLIGDPKKRTELAESGAQSSRERFSVEKHYETMESLFEAAAGAGGSRG